MAAMVEVGRTRVSGDVAQPTTPRATTPTRRFRRSPPARSLNSLLLLLSLLIAHPTSPRLLLLPLKSFLPSSKRCTSVFGGRLETSEAHRLHRRRARPSSSGLGRRGLLPFDGARGRDDGADWVDEDADSQLVRQPPSARRWGREEKDHRDEQDVGAWWSALKKTLEPF
ncbi:hypothetical protein BCR35DRAFT_144786 [Leucosporidium creatinivorum]|uniref:Uncharacterized protein n=1 Tax=Leucosporidium creatinivorum TaxID=106004 RepID=A0A1Y2ER70_9BASI|nr:hypothetical protein BCR35DRAFT_144786 [Leucosporidium creatinivorum]